MKFFQKKNSEKLQVDGYPSVEELEETCSFGIEEGNDIEEACSSDVHEKALKKKLFSFRKEKESVVDEAKDAEDHEKLKDFFKDLSGDDEELYLSEDPISNITDEIILESEDEKEGHGKVYAAITLIAIACVAAFYVSYFISQYNLILEPVKNAVYVINDKYSVTYKNPIVYATDIKENERILYKKDSRNRFIDNYSKAVVKQIKKRVVYAYDEDLKKYVDIPYEQIWYVVDPAFTVNDEDGVNTAGATVQEGDVDDAVTISEDGGE